jgi:hypothetical protein
MPSASTLTYISVAFALPIGSCAAAGCCPLPSTIRMLGPMLLTDSNDLSFPPLPSFSDHLLITTIKHNSTNFYFISQLKMHQLVMYQLAMHPSAECQSVVSVNLHNIHSVLFKLN